MAWCFALLSLPTPGCVVTDPIEFQEEVDVPPVIIDDPSYANGSIITYDSADVTAPKEIKIEIKVHDENTDQTLEVRRVVTRPDGEKIAYTCDPEETELLPGELDRPYNLVIPQAVLVPGGCHKVDVVVSGHFTDCEDTPDGRVLLQDRVQKDHKEDIARATYWIWEVSNNVLNSAMATQALAQGCKRIEYKAAVE